jgi:hypothetical protein
MIGTDCKWPNRCAVVNVGSPDRQIICSQRRSLSDALVPAWYVRFLYNCETEFFFVLNAQSVSAPENEVSKLEGRVYVYTKKKWHYKNKATNLHIAVSAKTALNAIFYEFKNSKDECRQETLKEMREKLRVSNIMDKSCVFSCSILLDRHGKLILDDLHVNEDIEYSPSLVREQGELNSKLYGFLYKQIYYFIKDISHAHKHHDKKHDTIIYAKELDSEFSWVRETQYSMHRSVLGHRRSGNVNRLNNAVGIMSYMASFEKYIKYEIENKAFGEVSIQNIEYSIGYDLSATENSIRAEIENAKEISEKKNIFWAAIIGIPSLLIGLFKDDSGKNYFEKVYKFTDSIFSDPFVCITLIALLIMFYVYRYGFANAYEISILKNPYRIYRSMNKEQSALYKLSLFMLMFLSAIFLKIEFNVIVWSSLRNACIYLWASLFTYLVFVLFYVPLALTFFQLCDRILEILTEFSSRVGSFLKTLSHPRK